MLDFPSLVVWGALMVWALAWGSALLVSWFVHWVSAAGDTGVGLVSPPAVWHWDMCCTAPRLCAM